MERTVPRRGTYAYAAAYRKNRPGRPSAARSSLLLVSLIPPRCPVMLILRYGLTVPTAYIYTRGAPLRTSEQRRNKRVICFRSATTRLTELPKFGDGSLGSSGSFFCFSRLHIRGYSRHKYRACRSGLFRPVHGFFGPESVSSS